jgi:hypothetical protein
VNVWAPSLVGGGAVEVMEVPVFEGSATERRLQAVAWVHGEFGGACAVCKKPSDLIEHAETDPSFKLWKRASRETRHATKFDMHHPDWKRTGPPAFRLGDIYVPSAGERAKNGQEYQKSEVLRQLGLLDGCELLCFACHQLHHKQHGGRVINRPC